MVDAARAPTPTPTLTPPAAKREAPRPPSPVTAAQAQSLFTLIRRRLASLSRWDLAALLGGGAGAVGWYGWSAMDVKDPVTPWYILLLPTCIVLFRRPIDRLLLPLQTVKQHVPRLVLIGAGLALPYFLAHYFYHHGVSEFPLARKTILWGTALSYVVMRIPQLGLPAGTGLPRGPGSLRIPCWFWLVLVAVGVLCLLAAYPALADDFARDRSRLQDGLRTGGWATGIAGTAGTGINILVNGGLVFQRPPAAGGSETEQQGERPAEYTMDVRTEGQRLSLVADGKDRLWLYAKITCNKAAVDATALTQAIAFRFEGEYADWMSIKSTQLSGGYQSVLLAASPPSEQAEIKENAKATVMVSGATADGEPMEATVELDLEGDLTLDVKVLA